MTKEESLEQSCSNWWKNTSVRCFDSFSSLSIYGICWARNSAIFQERRIPEEIITSMIVQWTREHKTMEKKKNKRMIKEPSIDKISLGNFSMELAKENLPWEDRVKLCIF